MEEKIYFTPGMRVCLKQDIPNKPIMIVVEKKTSLFKHSPDTKGNILKGIQCRWFTKEGVLQEAIFNTKDLMVI